MSRDMSHVREALFDTLDKLRNKQIEIETAKTIQEVSQTLLNSAKLEMEFLKHTDNVRSKFFDAEETSHSLQEAKAKHKALTETSEPVNEIEKTLKEIKENNTKPYEFDKPLKS